MRKLAIFVLLAAFAVPEVAFAHSNPESGQPAINGSVEAPVSSVNLTFDSPVVPSATSLHILDEHGARLDSGPTSVDPNAKVATVPTRALGKGVYTVAWANQSAEDGHDAQGYYIFSVAIGDPDGKVAFAGGQTDASGSAAVDKTVADIRLRLQTPASGLGFKTFEVSLSDDAGAPISGAFVRLRSKLSSIPGFPEYYKVAQPTQGTPGGYSAALPIGIEGSWTLTATISRDGKRDAELATPMSASAGLRPAATAAASTSSAPAIASTPGPSATPLPSQPSGSSPSAFPILPVVGIGLLVLLMVALLLGPWRRRP